MVKESTIAFHVKERESANTTEERIRVDYVEPVRTYVLMEKWKIIVESAEAIIIVNMGDNSLVVKNVKESGYANIKIGEEYANCAKI